MPFTPLTVKGGVVRVIDSATGDIARTTGGFIENEKYGVYCSALATAISVEFDSDVTRTGRLTVKISTTDTTGKVSAVIGYNSGTASSLAVTTLSKYAISLKGSTTYRVNCYVKTNNVLASNFQLHEYAISGTRNAINSSTNFASTANWTLYSKTFTTAASTVWGVIALNTATAGNISDAWFDVNSMTLEEVSSITNSGSTSALFYPKVTAVTSTDNIDQSDIADNSANAFGDGAGGHQKTARQFIPTKKNFTGFELKRTTGAGIYVGDVIVSIFADSGDKPTGAALVSTTIPNATWMGASTQTVLFDYTLTPGTKYWKVMDSSTQNNVNYTAERAISTSSGRSTWNGTAWSAIGTNAAYIKTLYSKNTTNFTVSTNTQTVSVTAPTTDGWANGTVIDTTTLGITVLTIPPGVNTIYYSSNGPATADGTVDPSLQMIMDGQYFPILKYWDGTAWTAKTLKWFDKNNWQTKTLKYWNGGEWI